MFQSSLSCPCFVQSGTATEVGVDERVAWWQVVEMETLPCVVVWAWQNDSRMSQGREKRAALELYDS